MKQVAKTKKSANHSTMYYRALLCAALITAGAWLLGQLRIWSFIPWNGYVVWLLAGALGAIIGSRLLPEIIENRRRLATGLITALVCFVIELYDVPLVPVSLQRPRPLPELIFAAVLCGLVTYLYINHRQRAKKITDSILAALLLVFIVVPLILLLWFLHAFTG